MPEPFNMNDTCDYSDDPPAMRHLTDAQKEQLAVLLEDYMLALEAGVPPSIECLTASYPELREAAEECVRGLESLQQMAGGERVAFPSTPGGAETLGDFELHEEVGRGGMGVVHRATQRSLHRTVAIKLLPLTSMLDSRRLLRFQQEAEAAASLHHPNIVPVHAVGFERGVHFYVMRFIDGVSMDAFKADWRTSVKQAIEIADGLHAAHELGIIHRDVKPSNLIVDATGKAWITDFGLARIQRDGSLTQSGDVIGTMRYMSPEQARGESAMVDGRTDMYSLGATLYEVLTGRPAHDGDDAPAILRQIDHHAVPPIKRFRKDLPRDLETVITKAMSARRDQRYETMAEFAQDLRRVLNSEPTVARPPSVLDHAVRIASKHRRSVAVATLVGTLALGGFAVSNHRLAKEKVVSDTNAQLAQKNQAITREAIDRLGSQVAELLRDIPGASSVRQRLLTETLSYYQQLVNDAETSAELNSERKLDLAITHGKIGSFEGQLGRQLAAVKSFATSESLLGDLATAADDDPDLQLQWSISQNNLAQAIATGGDFESSMTWFGKAISTQQALVSRSEDAGAPKRSGQQPFVDSAKRELATTLNNFGKMLTDSENVSEAETVFRRAIDLLTASEITDSQLRSAIESNLAGLLSHRDPAIAIDLASRALATQIQRLEKDPNDAKTATRVIATLNTLAAGQAATSRFQDAIQTLTQAVDIGERLRVRWPHQAAYRRDLGISLNQLGLAHSALKQMQTAERYFKRSTEQARALTEQFPDDAEVHSMLGSVLNNAAFLYRQTGNRRQAMQLFNEAIQQQRRAYELAPQVPRYQAFLQKHQRNLDEMRGTS